MTSEQDALDVCREVIDECRPRFMGILGGRYGWVREGHTASITAEDVHYGELDREAAKRGQALFYFRDDEATARMVDETPGEFRETARSENAQKLADLKEAVRTSFTQLSSSHRLAPEPQGRPGIFLCASGMNAVQRRMIR